MTKPFFVINFKAYDQAVGERCVQLAKTVEEIAKIKGVPVAVCVPATELRAVVAAVNIPVYAQHVDPVSPGAHTGWITPQMLVEAGAKGTLINHSEHRYGHDMEKAVAACKQAGLQVIICAQDVTEVKILRNLPADFIAYEPPELIGGDIAVSTAKPEAISQAVRQVPDKLLVGAGVKSRADVEKSIELGAKGVLLASGVVKVEKPRDILLELFTNW